MAEMLATTENTKRPNKISKFLRNGLAALCLLASSCQSAEDVDALNALNNDRVARRIAALSHNHDLFKKADAWAEKLAKEGRLYHSNLATGAPSCWRGLGENVGYGSSVKQVQQAFMDSPAHNANVVNRNFDNVGVGTAIDGSRVYVVQVFLDSC